jgi:hypothetical protein
VRRLGGAFFIPFLKKTTTIVWNLSIALVGALREAPLQKCLYYLLHIIKEMVLHHIPLLDFSSRTKSDL